MNIAKLLWQQLAFYPLPPSTHAHYLVYGWVVVSKLTRFSNKNEHVRITKLSNDLSEQ